MPKKGYKQTKEHKKNSSLAHKGQHSSPDTEFKKGQKAWNYEGKGKLKRKMKKFNGKLILNSHYVFCKDLGVEKIPRGFVIHHKDFNSLNDNIDNLILMTDKSHKSMHNFMAKMKISGDKLV